MSKRRIINKLYEGSLAQHKGQQLRTANSQIVNKSSTQLSTDVGGKSTPPQTDETGLAARNAGVAPRGFADTGIDKGGESPLDHDLTGTQIISGSQQPQRTELQKCVDAELTKYFAMLENDPPTDLYRLVMSQVESAVINYVLDVCGNNQSRAAVYLGISRGKLRSRIKELSLE